jgi:hypothetical protein
MKFSFGDRIYLKVPAYGLKRDSVGLVVDEEPDFIEVRIEGYPHAIPMTQAKANALLEHLPRDLAERA